jgi:DNA polymerase-4
MERDILHLAIPAFPIALARVGDSSLRQRPVAVAPGNSERSLLQCVSAEARAEGVHEGMPLFRARRYCPSLILLTPDPRLVARGTQALLEVSGQYTPIWEPTAAGRLFLDLTGGRRLFGPGRDVAARLERELERRLRLAGSVGVAGNKLISHIASGFLKKPGVCDILRGSERSFLGPLPVSVLPGVGSARESVLMQDLNLRRVEEVAALSVAQLRLPFGPFAPLLLQRAQGIDPSPVQPPRRSPEVAEEAFLEQEENDDERLLAELFRLAESCGMRLRRLGQTAGRLSLGLTYADGVMEQGTASFPNPVANDLALFAALEDLFYKTSKRRLRLRVIRLVCGRLSAGSSQLGLFDPDPADRPTTDALQDALDQLRTRHGMATVRWGRSLAGTEVSR